MTVRELTVASVTTPGVPVISLSRNPRRGKHQGFVT
jgi:hypothetical protein